jgi:hypothetical protein
MKKNILFNVFLLAFFIFQTTTTSAGEPERLSCIKDCQYVKNGDLKYCEKLTGEKRSKCRDDAASDYLKCSVRCDSKYGKK